MHFVLQTDQELPQLHHNFGHPTAFALENMLERASADQLDNETKQTINETVNTCKTCQKFASKSRRFKKKMGSKF